MTEHPEHFRDDQDDPLVFPLPVDDDHDELGVEVALRIAHGVAGILPPPRGVRRRPRTLNVEERSSAFPDERDPQPLDGAVGMFVRQQGWRTELGVRRMLDRWPEIVGAANAEHSRPVEYKQKVLVVQAESTTWATVLRQLSPQIVARLNDELGDGAVRRIDVRGPAAPSWKHGPRSVRDGRGPRDTYG